MSLRDAIAARGPDHQLAIAKQVNGNPVNFCSVTYSIGASLLRNVDTFLKLVQFFAAEHIPEREHGME